jgi:hypothetical protein
VTIARPVDSPEDAFPTSVRNVAAESGFYWATGADGVEAHEMERVLGRIEAAALPAFNKVLDHHTWALSFDWPLPEPLRDTLAWWMAAQLLRTSRRRLRIAHQLDSSPTLAPPGPIAAALARDVHVAYIGQELAALARVLAARPWALGFSDACLITGDVPVVIINRNDAADQIGAAAVYSVLLPLDPHRFLYLPNVVNLREDRRKQVDHRMKLDGGMGYLLSQIIRDAATRHTFHHPDHPPHPNLHDDTPRLPRPWDGDDLTNSPEYYISYATFPADAAIERTWLTNHPQQVAFGPAADQPATDPEPDDKREGGP